jgi:hypothetical protein
LVGAAGAVHELANVERRTTMPVRITVNNRLELDIKSITSGKTNNVNNVLEKYSYRITCWQIGIKAGSVKQAIKKPPHRRLSEFPLFINYNIAIWLCQSFIPGASFTLISGGR